MRLPVVASDLPEIREVTTERGAHLVPPGNPALLAERLAELIANPELGRASAAEGRRHVGSRFDARQNARRFAEVLHRAAQ